MTTPPHDDQVDPYLWDSTAPEAEDVRVLEQRLAPLRFDPARMPLVWTAPNTHLRPLRRWAFRESSSGCGGEVAECAVA
jgi:hypothetical protein